MQGAAAIELFLLVFWLWLWVFVWTEYLWVVHPRERFADVGREGEEETRRACETLQAGFDLRVDGRFCVSLVGHSCRSL